MMSINAVKGVEIGNGFESVSLPGESNVDEIRIENGKPKFLSNNSGGILGGISTGQDIIVKFCCIVRVCDNFATNAIRCGSGQKDSGWKDRPGRLPEGGHWQGARTRALQACVVDCVIELTR